MKYFSLMFGFSLMMGLNVNAQETSAIESEKENAYAFPKYKSDIETIVARNGSNSVWQVKSEELLDAKPIDVNSSFQSNTIFLDNNSVELNKPFSFELSKRIGDSETAVGTGTLILNGNTYSEVVKTQKINIETADESNSAYSYSVISNWYTNTKGENSKLVLSITDNHVSVGSLDQVVTSVHLNRGVKNDIINYNIVKFYPVPAKDEVTLEVFIKNRVSQVEFKIINSLGAVVATKNLGIQESGLKQHSIKINDVSSGNYTIHLIVDGVVFDRCKLAILH